MSAKKPNLIRIAVTNGDAMPDNRVSGKSNTGTYFVCSNADFSNFGEFFKEGLEYKFDCKRTVAYCLALPAVYKDYSRYYPHGFDPMSPFSAYFANAKRDPETNIGLRINDPRIFMRFLDNNEIYTNAFRNLLFAEISVIVLELTEDDCGNEVCLVYPDVDYSGDKPTFKKLFAGETLTDDDRQDGEDNVVIY